LDTTISGYTLLEIVVVLVLVGILAAVLAPRLIDTSGFTGQTTADQLLAAARYAEALAQNQGVATTLNVTGTAFSVTQNGAPVANPTLQSASFVVPLPAGVTVTRRKPKRSSNDRPVARGRDGYAAGGYLHASRRAQYRGRF